MCEKRAFVAPKFCSKVENNFAKPIILRFMKQKIVVGIAGSSGSIYAKVLLDKLVLLREQTAAVGVVLSENARFNWKLELGSDIENSQYPFDFYENAILWPLLPAVRRVFRR